ncbi:MAG: hypothetical protein VX772_04450 [Bacteroidota bacterium]|nr:hypothetical protein [Bacteroidota bacterium]
MVRFNLDEVNGIEFEVNRRRTGFFKQSALRIIENTFFQSDSKQFSGSGIKKGQHVQA